MTGNVTLNHQYDAAGNTTLTYMTLTNGSGASTYDRFTAYDDLASDVITYTNEKGPVRLVRNATRGGGAAAKAKNSMRRGHEEIGVPVKKPGALSQMAHPQRPRPVLDGGIWESRRTLLRPGDCPLHRDAGSPKNPQCDLSRLSHGMAWFAKRRVVVKCADQT